MSQIDDVFNIMTQHKHQWRIDGRLAEPTLDDVARVYGKMIEDLSKLDGSVSIQCGGIMLVKDTDKIAVYVYIGDVDEDSSN